MVVGGLQRVDTMPRTALPRIVTTILYSCWKHICFQQDLVSPVENEVRSTSERALPLGSVSYSAVPVPIGLAWIRVSPPITS
jgi:hypothetical protein